MRGKFCYSLRNGSYSKVVDCLLFNLSANAASSWSTVAKNSASQKSISTKTPSQFYLTETDVSSEKKLLRTEKQGIPRQQTGTLTSTR